MPTFVIFKDIINQYRWRLVAVNGEIIASSEAYASHGGALRSAERVKAIAGTAMITTEEE